MRLTRKLTVALACAILIVLGVDGAIRVQHKAGLFEVERRRDARVLGRTVAGAAAWIWRTVGEPTARDLVENANDRNSEATVRWVWLEAPRGSPRSPDVPREQIGPLAKGNARSIRWHAEDASAEALYTYYALAIPLPGRAIEIRESLDAERAYVRQTIASGIVTTGALVVVCAAVASTIGALFVGGPVRRLVDQARRVGHGDLSTRITVRQRDEIGQLAGEMNIMCDRLVEARARLEAETRARILALEQLRHADRLTTVGKLAAGLAHEIGTPLNVITGHAQLIADEHPADGSAHENAVIIGQQAERVASTIRQLLDFARLRSPQPACHDLVALVRETAAMLGSLAHKSGVTFEIEASEEEVWGRVDRAQLQQVLTNLVVNGMHAMPDGGRLTLRVNRRPVVPPTDHGGPVDEYLCLDVADEGVGVDPDHLARVFEPFFTTKDVGEGTGLGLSVSYGIVREHGGWIGVESAPGQGSCFSIYLPPEVRA
jgi:signal transduction histidine kinase